MQSAKRKKHLQPFRAIRKPLRGQESGVAFIEIAVTVPIFIALVFWFLWYGLALHARSHLIGAMGDALLFGVTRSDTSMFRGTPVISDLDSYTEASGPTDRVKELLYRKGTSDSEGVTDFDESKLLSYAVHPVFTSAHSFKTLPKSYAFTLAFMHEFMRIRLGKAFLKYPCDDRPGCLGCRFINPESILDPDLAPISTVSDPGADFSHDVVGIQCTYVSELFFYSTISGIFGGGMPSITRTFSINRSRD